MRDAQIKSIASACEHGAEAFVSFFIRYCLHYLFKSKKEMAEELKIGYQTILLVTNTPEKYKRASLVFQELVIYCVGKGISLDEIIKEFNQRSDQRGIAPKCVLRDSSFFSLCYDLSPQGDTPQGSEEEIRTLANVRQFMRQVQEICCRGCLRCWDREAFVECPIRQTIDVIADRMKE